MPAKPSRKELEEKIKKLETQVAEYQKPADPLVQNGNFYNLCIESAPYGIMAHDEEGRILIFNSQLERISGYRQAEIPDVKTWIAKLYPDEEYRNVFLTTAR